LVLCTVPSLQQGKYNPTPPSEPELGGTPTVCMPAQAWGCTRPVGGPLNILVDVSFPPLLLRPWSGHFYASDSFMKHKTWSNTWHEIGNKAEQKKEQFSGRM